MDKESVLQKSREENKNGDEYVIQKRNRAEHSSLLIVSAGFCFCALVKCSELLPANSGSDKGKLILAEHYFSSCF